MGLGYLGRLWDVRDVYWGCVGGRERRGWRVGVWEKNVKADRRTMGKLHILPFIKITNDYVTNQEKEEQKEEEEEEEEEEEKEEGK